MINIPERASCRLPNGEIDWDLFDIWWKAHVKQAEANMDAKYGRTPSPTRVYWGFSIDDDCWPTDD